MNGDNLAGPESERPTDHAERMQRALRSLDGLSVGDGFGETFFTSSVIIESRLERREPPPPPWTVTDDTMMAVSIVRCLKRFSRIEQDTLATLFAREYARDSLRGYGGMAHRILQCIGQGMSWKVVARGSLLQGNLAVRT